MSSDPTYPDAKETMDSGQLAFLTAHLPRFSHHIVKASSARAVYQLQQGPLACMTDIMVTPEREKSLIFAKRRMGLPGFRVIIRKERLGALTPALDASGAVDLAKLADMDNLTGAYTKSRHYGPVVSEFIRRRDSKGLEGEVANFQLFNLLAARRIDFAFVLPMDFYYYLPEDQRNQVVLLPVAGEAPTMTATIACTSDPAGRAVIRDIDTLLADNSRWADYVEPLRKWVAPEDFGALLVSGSDMDRVP